MTKTHLNMRLQADGVFLCAGELGRVPVVTDATRATERAEFLHLRARRASWVKLCKNRVDFNHDRRGLPANETRVRADLTHAVY